MAEAREPNTALRLSIIGVVTVSLFGSLFARLYYLQVINSQDYVVAAESAQLRVIHEQGPRGRILDRNGNVLVDNVVSIVVGLDKQELRTSGYGAGDRNVEDSVDEVENRQELFGRFSTLLFDYGQPTKVVTIDELYNDPRYGPQDFVPVLEEVPEELELFLAEHRDEYPGIEVRRRAVRTYPYGRLAAHILGYVGQINEDELAAKQEMVGEPGEVDTSEKPYVGGDEIGKAGVERSFEENLRAVPGVTEIQVDARGDYVRTTKEPELTPGDDVWLTIDVRLQALAESQLAWMIAQRNPSVACDRDNACAAKEGAVVVVEPGTGEVLAMASYPTFDPDDLVNGVSSVLWDRLTGESSNKPMLNRGVAETFAPGSTFKLITATAAVQGGYLTPTDTINDTGVWRLEGCTSGKCEFQNASRARYGTVDLQQAMTVSSDVFFYRIGDQMWRGRELFGETPIQDTAAQFGLGESTDVGLPSESAGLIGTPNFLAEAHAKNPDGWPRADWAIGDSINIAIGQGLVSVTPLQLANAYATFANGGTRYQPRIVRLVSRPRDLARSVVDWRNLEVVEDFAPRKVGEVTYPTPESYSAIYRGLQGVTASGRGTASGPFSANPTAWPLAGKTGTAEVDRKADTSVFVAFGPADGATPAEFAVSAILPEAGFGSDASAPLVFSILAPVSQPGGLDALPEPPHTPVPGVTVENTSVSVPPTTSTTLPTRKIIPVEGDDGESAWGPPLSDRPRATPRVERAPQ